MEHIETGHGRFISSWTVLYVIKLKITPICMVLNNIYTLEGG